VGEVSQAQLSSAPVVTTVIPTFRRPRLLRRAILSVLGQTFPHVRVCVYDNASGDGTEAVVAELMRHDARVRYYRHQENIGSYPNFNYGLREVVTPYLSLLSDDDVLAPRFYEHALRAFARYPESMFVCMPTMVVDATLRVLSPPIPVKQEQFYRQGEAVTGMLAGAVPGTWTGIVFRRDVCDGVGFIDTTVGPHADGAFVYHVAARFPGVVVPGVAAVLMSHEQSVSGTSIPVTGEWVNWWHSMMKAIYEDSQVPEHVRRAIKERPVPNYLYIGLKQVGRALARREYAYASRVAIGIRECNHPLVSVLLSGLVWCCYRLHADSLVRFVNIARQCVLNRKIDFLCKQYGVQAEFVRQYMQDDVTT